MTEYLARIKDIFEKHAAIDEPLSYRCLCSMALDRSMTYLLPLPLTEQISLHWMKYTAYCIPLNIEWNRECLAKTSPFLKLTCHPIPITKAPNHSPGHLTGTIQT